MTRRKLWAWLVLAAFLAAVGLAIAATAPDTVTLNKVKDKMAPVVFPHKAHAVDQKIECKTCHHKDADPAKAVVSCYNCHKAAADAATKAPDAKTAFHTRCQGCHKEKAAANPNFKGPTTKCMDCHKKAAP